MATPQPARVLENFKIPAGLRELQPISEGLINDTFRVSIPNSDGYVLQRINTEVFPDPDALMENLERILPKLRGDGYRQLELIRTTDGRAWYQNAGSGAWRLYKFIPGSRTISDAQQPGVARETGRILGRFHQLLQDTDPGILHPVLPGFHDLGLRIQQLNAAETQGLPDRVARGRKLAEQARVLASQMEAVRLDTLPTRVCHNDPKLSNILFSTGLRPKALCLIDLDTLMPGALLFDFGDAGRTLINSLAEEQPEDGTNEIDWRAYREFCQGFAAACPELSAAESASLPYGLLLMPLLHGARALADYYLGDLHYKVSYETQNLVRARNLLRVAGTAGEEINRLRKTWAAAREET
ncbi:phosphotransferase enzyme family protein [Robiginitalea biformata]|uniref:phosphotransferase enzyme family protein n=1 Tax=Robiginitalea biformata TaxID=252307 RepID=UPI003B5BDA5B